MIEEIKLIEYNTWASRRILDQLVTLPIGFFLKEVGGSFPSIKKTMRHLLEADWIWMNRLTGSQIVDIPPDWSTETASDFSNHWATVHSQMESSVRKLAAIPGNEIKFVTKKGVPYSLPLGEIVIQIVNHGTYHRGQVTNMIRILGHEPAHTDYFIFCTSRE